MTSHGTVPGVLAIFCPDVYFVPVEPRGRAPGCRIRTRGFQTIMFKKGGAYRSLKPVSIRSEGPAVGVFRKRDCILPGERAHLADMFVKSSNILYELTLIYATGQSRGIVVRDLGRSAPHLTGRGCRNLPGGALHPILHPVRTRYGTSISQCSYRMILSCAIYATGNFLEGTAECALVLRV
jgi:hypothetical protein